MTTDVPVIYLLDVITGSSTEPIVEQYEFKHEKVMNNQIIAIANGDSKARFKVTELAAIKTYDAKTGQSVEKFNVSII